MLLPPVAAAATTALLIFCADCIKALLVKMSINAQRSASNWPCSTLIQVLSYLSAVLRLSVARMRQSVLTVLLLFSQCTVRVIKSSEVSRKDGIKLQSHPYFLITSENFISLMVSV